MKKTDIFDIKLIDETTITVVYYKNSDCIHDIIVTLPEVYEHEPISFLDVGLINAGAETIEPINQNTKYPSVNIGFYGNFKRETID